MVATKVEGLSLRDWRGQYLQAARANDVAAMRALVSQLSTYIKGCNVPGLVQADVDGGGWQQLCLQAQHEQDPNKLLKLVTEINRLLEEDQDRKRRR